MDANAVVSARGGARKHAETMFAFELRGALTPTDRTQEPGNETPQSRANR